ncbi:hypothetical protein EAS56_31960 [Bradyrhizobium guangzhouense]|uniref:BA14K family protein n=1 Tax=Bradyrhizobium guangzhouense TaxID=1325095 RepID=A0AAE6C8D0_9BRAD|nr:hypothetical protein XH91_14060 [Bradyrhizobium guangzhouense]RXH07659.1 hypothetical protein EAS56_31960 [Bradyrhizobium guangzhouense]
MNVRTVCAVLILSGLSAVAARPPPLLAQSTVTGVSAPKESGAAAPEAATPNTNTNPTKHRYWRHRGGKHPHFGSRRTRT